MIPKIIHYCWFGDAAMPAECMDTWKTEGYEVVRWDEKCDYIQNDSRLKELVKKKKWAYLSDYIRLKALYDYGGIYMDTDVVMLRKFDGLLCNKMFLGYIYPKSIGTAVIGCEPHHEFIESVIGLYDETILPNYLEDKFSFVLQDSPVLVNNNDIFTWMLLQRRDFKLDGKPRELADMQILGMSALEAGGFGTGSYTLHRCYGSWIEKLSEAAKKPCIPLEMLRLRFVSWRLADKLPFRDY